jgi:hypothetical protein
MGLHLAHPVVAYLDCMAHQLGRGVVLVRSNGKAHHDLGLTSLPRLYYRGSLSAYALHVPLAWAQMRSFCKGRVKEDSHPTRPT